MMNNKINFGEMDCEDAGWTELAQTVGFGINGAVSASSIMRLVLVNFMLMNSDPIKNKIIAHIVTEDECGNTTLSGLRAPLNDVGCSGSCSADNNGQGYPRIPRNFPKVNTFVKVTVKFLQVPSPVLCST
jgi:hypothetical protein